jgi:hypothetical protein
VFALVGLWMGLDPLGDNSFFTHLATGRLIIDGTFPSADPYSFTAAGSPWVVQSWLPSVLYASLESIAGADAIRLLIGMVTAALAAIVWALTRPASTVLPRVLITVLVLLIGLFAWSPRPALIGLLLLGVALLAAEGRLGPVWLLPVFWVWANSHGSYPLGLVLLALLAAGARLDGGRPTLELRCLAWAALGAVLGVVGPLGLSALTFPFDVLSHTESLEAITEWQPPSFDRFWHQVFIVQVAVAIVALVRRPSYRDALPLVCFTALALLALRNVAVASIVLVPGMARGLVDIGSSRAEERGRSAVAALVVVALLAMVVVVDRLDEESFDLRGDPVAAVAWLDERDLVAERGVRVATRDTTGNFLELLYGADAQVFIDDRADMYPTEVFGDYVALLDGDDSWSAILDDHEIDLVLWPRDKPLAGLLAADAGWHLVYQDEDWVIACSRARFDGCADLT